MKIGEEKMMKMNKVVVVVVPSSGGVVDGKHWLLHELQEDKWVTLLSDAFSFWCSKSSLFHCRSYQVTENRKKKKKKHFKDGERNKS